MNHANDLTCGLLQRRACRIADRLPGGMRCLCAAVLLAAVSAPPARAADYPVSNTDDQGPGSLRAALVQANAHFGPDRITFLFTDGTIVLATSLPTITDDVALVAPDASNLTVSGNNATGVFRINTGVNVKLTMLDVESGHQASGDGGCIHNAGNLVLDRVILQSCVASNYGGAIFNAATGAVTLIRSAMFQSEAYRGGGIYNLGEVSITNDSHVNIGTATFGAGIDNEEGAFLTITDSNVWGNAASISAGGILNAGGAVTIVNSLVGGNTADWDAGGIYHDGLSSAGDSLTLSGVSFYHNVAGTDGGALETVGAGASIEGSLFEGNTAARGGGIYANSGGMHIRNSTFSANSAGTGGALFGVGPNPILTQVTLVDNSATQPGGIATVVGEVTIKNSILVGSGTNCGGVVTSHGHNLLQIGADHSCGGGDAVSAAELLLGPLARHGGPTLTYSLAPGSVAIDSAWDCTDALGDPVSVDGRGMPRPADGDGNGTKVCDVGAFEVAADAIFADGFEP